jgi:hypothetical protein
MRKEWRVYTTVERRKVSRKRLQETIQRAEGEFFHKLQRAPGFVGFYLVSDERTTSTQQSSSGRMRARAEAFDERWLQTLDELGHTLQSDNRGETTIQLEPQK